MLSAALFTSCSLMINENQQGHGNRVDHEVPEITEVMHEQSKAVPDFDGSEQTETDPQRLDELRNLLIENGWQPGRKYTDPGCDGATSTHLEITFADGTDSDLDVIDCSGSPAFIDDLTGLIGSWRD